MVRKNAPMFDGYPTIRKRVESSDMFSYVLTYPDVHTIRGVHPLEMVALKAYGDSKYWFIIADVNPLRDPTLWKEGDTVLVPRETPSILIRNTGE